MPKTRYAGDDAAMFGALIHGLRTERAWTLSDLARAADMNADWLGVLECGRNVPSLSTILRLARALEVSAASLVEAIEKAHDKQLKPPR
jgi:transcriptional regulator with XRE-family HTH domain